MFHNMSALKCSACTLYACDNHKPAHSVCYREILYMYVWVGIYLGVGDATVWSVSWANSVLNVLHFRAFICSCSEVFWLVGPSACATHPNLYLKYTVFILTSTWNQKHMSKAECNEASDLWYGIDFTFLNHTQAVLLHKENTSIAVICTASGCDLWI